MLGIETLSAMFESAFDKDWECASWLDNKDFTFVIRGTKKNCTVEYKFNVIEADKFKFSSQSFHNEFILVMSTQIHMDILKQLKEKHAAEMEQAQTEIKKLKDRCAVQEEKIELLKEILKSRKD